MPNAMSEEVKNNKENYLQPYKGHVKTIVKKYTFKYF